MNVLDIVNITPLTERKIKGGRERRKNDSMVLQNDSNFIPLVSPF